MNARPYPSSQPFKTEIQDLLQACKYFFSLIRAFVSPGLMFTGWEAGLVGQNTLIGRQQNSSFSVSN